MGIQQIQHRYRLMHPHQSLKLWRDAAMNQRKMRPTTGCITKRNSVEDAVRGLHLALANSLNNALVLASVVN